MRSNNYLKQFAAFIFATLAVTACDEDAQPASVKISDMDEVTLSHAQCHTTLNGSMIDIQGVEFDYDENDDKVSLRIKGLTAAENTEYTLDLNTTPGERTVDFTGRKETPGYVLTATGTYTPAEKYVTDGYIELQLSYTPRGIETGRTFVFKTGKDFLQVNKEIFGTTTHNDSVYPNEMTIRNALVNIGEYLSTKYEGLSMRFNDDLTLDINIKYAGEEAFKPWMTVRYWFTETDKELILELTNEQRNAFHETWTGIPDGPYVPVFTTGFPDRNPLTMFYYTDSGQLSIGLANTQNGAALSMFTGAFGTEWPDSNDIDELRVARDALWNAIRDGQRVEIALKSEPTE